MSDYKIMNAQLEALSESSRNYIPLLSNASALIYENMKDLNWAGFYLVRNDALLLGPFQGKVACVNIAKGKGVCGTAYATDETQLVNNSEIVVPIHHEGEVVAVLDIDSPLLSRFDEADKEGLESFVRKLEELIDWDITIEAE